MRAVRAAVVEMMEPRRLLTAYPYVVPTGHTAVYLQPNLVTFKVDVYLDTTSKPNPDFTFTNTTGQDLIDCGNYTTATGSITVYDQVPAALKPRSDGAHQGIKVQNGWNTALEIDAGPNDTDISCTNSSSTGFDVVTRDPNVIEPVTNDVLDIHTFAGSGVQFLTLRTNDAGGATVYIPVLATGIHLTVDTGAGTYNTISLGDGASIVEPVNVITGAGHDTVNIQLEEADDQVTAFVDFGPGDVGGAVGLGNKLVVRGAGSAHLTHLRTDPGDPIVVDTVEARSGDPGNGGSVFVDEAAVIGTLDIFGIGSVSVVGAGSLAADAVTLTDTGSFLSVQAPVAFGSLHVHGVAELTSGAASSDLGAVDIHDGGALNLLPGASVSAGSLTIDSSSHLDLNDNVMAVNYAGTTPLSTIRDYLHSGRNGGAWNSPEINSTFAAANAATGLATTAIGYGEASDVLGLTTGTTTWNGLAVDATTVLLKYTYYGDVNLNGTIDNDDYTFTDLGFARYNSSPTAPNHIPADTAVWHQGDFDYDGDVDTDDYFLIDRAFALKGGVLSPDFIADREIEFGSTYADALRALAASTGTGAMAPAVIAQDVGSPSVSGSTTGVTQGADYDLTAGGTGLTSAADQFQFAWQLLSGDFDLRARVDSLSSNGAADPLAGLMARAGLDAGDNFLFIGKVYHTATSAGAFKGLYRTTTDAAPTADTWPLVANYSPAVWVRLKRTGSTIYAYYSTNGTAWTLYHAGASPNGAGDVYVGMAATAGDSTHTATAGFREFAPMQTQSALTLNLTAGNDVRYLRLDATAHTLQVWDHRPTDPDSPADLPDWTYDYFAISGLTINGLAGDDSVYFDFANGFINFTAGITYAGGDGADDTLTYIGTPASEGFVRNNENSAWWIADTDQYYAGISYGNDTLVHFTDVEHHLFEGNGAPAGNNWDSYGFTAGTWSVGYDLGTASPKLLLNVAADVDVTFSASQHLGFLQILDDGSVTLSGTSTVLVTTYANFQGDWSFDLADAKFIFDWTGTTVASQFVSMLHTAYNAGAWDGGGLHSSLAAADSITGIAYAETSALLGLSGSQTATWAGETVDASSLVFKRTYYGDTDLDGDVDQADLDAYAAAVANNSAATWQTGDFNYDGVRDAADYALMTNAYANQASPL